MSSENGFLAVSPKGHLLYERVSRLLKPTKRTTPDQWGADNRVYPPSAGHPGPRDPSLTPYTIPFSRAVHEGTYPRNALVMFAQGGKSEVFLDIIGHRMDTAPVPILYTGPSQQFVREQWEPRVTALFDEAPKLKRKLPRGKRMSKTRKVISGVPLRLAHGGSSTALKSDPAGLCLTDEVDDLLSNVKGQGNPLRLIDQRGETYPNFVHAMVSTPSTGLSEIEVDPETGLEFWAVQDPEQISSTIWKTFQSGTRRHWAWPCPQCGEYFIPRFNRLKWDKPKDASGRELPSTPIMAKKTAYLLCPCGCPIGHEHKDWMNERGVYVAPGQKITSDGKVSGQPPDSITDSYWVSGLASPFSSWGERAARYVEAVRSGDPDEVQVVLNAQFGELYAEGGGEVPSWKAISKLASETYVSGQVPSGVKLIIVTVDVQKNRLVYVVRGWGAKATSWLIEAGEIHGETAELEVWDTLGEFIQGDWDGIPAKLVLVDAGFRPGKKDTVPVNRVYEFCRKHISLAKPTKGSSHQMVRPIVVSKIDVNANGKLFKRALEQHRLDTDHWKRWVHERVSWNLEQDGAWHLPEDITEDYCRQIVSEARVKKASGEVKWVPRSKENHFFDCESMQAAAASMLNVLKLRENSPTHRRKPSKPMESQTKSTGSGWLGEESIW
ncbi:phage terminase large subunit (GpA) [Roseibium sp. TrichSKD4]|uniref:terminase gpA endonuclease subunit n=1 Tax=Roseibium sp. TrichSKD4 TaxID=744980 RepID=UPI0001E56CCE|nr:terminase gpA endonuclease subunit [Roseibium sp. TrichSKD4]EFO32121.1 phage terminase large subunit (GpA) [Roseibium sp. TrichSKD4]